MSRPPSVDALARSLTGLPHPLAVDIARQAISRRGRRRGAGQGARRCAGRCSRRSSTPRACCCTPTSAARRWPTTRTPGRRSLELDLATGERGSRQRAVGQLYARLCGAEAAMIVNNNAAAVLLVLAALAAGRAVPVSRGESVEIGGGFRVPEVMEQSGAVLVDVGTTNRTRARRLSPGGRQRRRRHGPQGAPEQLPRRRVRRGHAGRRAGDARPARCRRPRQRPARRHLPVVAGSAPAGVAGRRAGRRADARRRRRPRHVQRRQAARRAAGRDHRRAGRDSSSAAAVIRSPAPCAPAGSSSPRCRTSPSPISAATS